MVDDNKDDGDDDNDDGIGDDDSGSDVVDVIIGGDDKMLVAMKMSFRTFRLVSDDFNTSVTNTQFPGIDP